MKKMFSTLITLLLLTACANTAGPGRPQAMDIRYGRVLTVNRVPLPAVVPAGAIVGGVTGLMLAGDRNPQRQVITGVSSATLSGATAFGLLNNRQTYEYRLQFNNGTRSNYITENSLLRAGDCIAVERRAHANLRRVSDAYCEATPLPAQVSTRRQTEANLCHEAKEQLLLAASEAEIEQASNNMRLMCQF